MIIPFGDLKRHYETYKEEFDASIQTILDSGWFVLGKAGEKFEQEFADYCDAEYAVGVGSGTEAIQLALMAAGIRAGDEVITVANTCVPTVSGIVSAGARPILTDVDGHDYTMSASDLVEKLSERTKAIVPVHLYGQSADLDSINEVAGRHGIPVIEDAAQGHGTKYKNRLIGSIGLMTAFSFYPSKNLGCFGDGGCITTNDSELASRLKMLRNYGQRERYYHSMHGINSRLDEIQAALLSSKLLYLDRWNERRRELSQMYSDGISNPLVKKPLEMSYGFHVWHLYVVRVKKRAHFQAFLSQHGIGTMIHYPVPIHLQEAYLFLGYNAGDFPVTEELAQEIVSLPMYPELKDSEVKHTCEVINSFSE